MVTRSREQSTREVLDSKIVAILRGDFESAQLLEIAQAIVGGGISVIELTLNSQGALKGIETLRSHLAAEVLVGAGTVRTRAHARDALDAGAEFLVSPNLDLDCVRFAREEDVLHLPGVFTPTEAQAALNLGCKLLKLFPCDAVGPGHVKALRGPLEDALFVPTGGVAPENAAAFLAAGAAALGIGGELTRHGAEPQLVGKVASEMVRAVQEAASSSGSSVQV
ncbi:MAG: bifunctional 4-hydroxy-2-oxoglutarate aldolase/2-dehydro-3-deoxy-phosphogluconate aldolase [Trueperaceae bacterium]